MNACASVSAVIQDELTARVATHEHETIELSGLKGGVNDAHFKAVVRRCRKALARDALRVGTLYSLVQ